MRIRLLLGLAVLAGVWWFVVRPGGAAAKAGPDSGPAGDKTVVVLSPGHGWWSTDSQSIDPGATGAGLAEKDVALDVTQQAQRLLDRCPVQARLTRTGDDKNHTLANVHELVNADKPALAVAVHVAAAGAPSGPAAWYTVGGQDDAGSQRLAATLTTVVAGRVGLPNQGIQPETGSPNGGLYIHPWQAPAVLLDLGSLGADSELLRNQRAEFGRALAQGVLAYLGLPGDCADGALTEGEAGLVSVSFPNEPVSLNLSLTNDGLGGWGPEQYRLVSVGERYGAAAEYRLPAAVAPGESATWALPARAPKQAGVYEQRWQLMRGDTRVGDEVRLLIVVAPPQAQVLKDKLDQQVAEWKAAGAAKVDDLVEQMKRELKDWALQEAERQASKCIGLNSAVMVGILALVAGKKKRRRISAGDASEARPPRPE